MTSLTNKPVFEHVEKRTYGPEQQTDIQVTVGSDELENNDLQENRYKLKNQVVTIVDKDDNTIETEHKKRISVRHKKPPKRLIEEQ